MLWEVFQLKSLYGLRWPKWCGGDTCTRWVTIYSIYTTELIWNCNTSTRGQCWVLRLCPGCCQFLRQKHNQPWLRNSWYSSYSEKGPYKGSPGDGSSLSGHDMLYISRWMDIFSSWLQLLLFFFCSFLLGFFFGSMQIIPTHESVCPSSSLLRFPHMKPPSSFWHRGITTSLWPKRCDYDMYRNNWEILLLRKYTPYTVLYTLLQS